MKVHAIPTCCNTLSSISSPSNFNFLSQLLPVLFNSLIDSSNNVIRVDRSFEKF